MRVLVALTLALAVSWGEVRDFPPGDARQCYSDVSTDVARFEVLPGSGWDNLQNVEMGAVLDLNYSLCRTTEDNHFLVPDLVNVYPVKTSAVDSFAEIIDHWSEYKSSTSKTINLDAGFKGVIDISGSFSEDFTSTKKKQIEDKTMTTRVQARYVRYRSVVQPDTPLHPGFKYRLLTIAASLETGDHRQARFQSQQMVREFGTHVVTSVDAGAAIMQEEQVSQSLKEYKTYSKSALKAAAGFSFTVGVGTFFAGASTTSTVQKAFNTVYMDNRTDSVVKAIGGNIVNRTSMKVADWVKQIDDDLVAIDRAGEPLYNFINAQTLPEIPDSTLLQLVGMVQEAVFTYYKLNTHPGCTDQTASNFSPGANHDDGSCLDNSNHTLTFGGLYQTCNHTAVDAGDLCTRLTQHNPATGDFTCPDGYEAVTLYSGVKVKQEVEHVCGSCWLIFGHCCHEEVKTSQAQYETSWCFQSSSTEEAEENSGYLFGGLYTSHVINPVTSSMTCPTSYITLKMGEDIRVCISDEFDQASLYSVPFGGFFSCSAGNPLSFNKGTQSKLTAHMYSAGPHTWSRQCPRGYSRYVTAVMPDDGCEINHCIKAAAIGYIKLPALRRPPFMDAPVSTPNAQNIFVFDPAQNMWLRNAMVAQRFPNISRPTAVLPTLRGRPYHGQGRPHHHEHDRDHHDEHKQEKKLDNLLVISEASMMGTIAFLGVLIIVLIYYLKKNSSNNNRHHYHTQNHSGVNDSNLGLHSVVSGRGEKC